jgi:methionine-gamma-lyase
MSAISTVLYACLSAGDGILTQGNLYGGTTELLKKVAQRHGINTYFIDFNDINQIEHAMSSYGEIKMIYLETPANPTLACVDLEYLVGLAKKKGILTMIDNTFCTPYVQQPLKYGIDFVIHSTTKFLNGHGNSISGAIISKRIDLRHRVWETLKLMGATCNPFDAWLLHNGLKTLALRMDKHCNNALYLAQKLKEHDSIERVNYNGLPDNPYHEIAKRQMNQFGGMLSFEIKGDVEMTKQFIDALTICTHAPTLGDVDTLVLHPATSSHLNVDRALRESNGITDNLVRMSVGIEEAEDIYQDVIQALERIIR